MDLNSPNVVFVVVLLLRGFGVVVEERSTRAGKRSSTRYSDCMFYAALQHNFEQLHISPNFDFTCLGFSL